MNISEFLTKVVNSVKKLLPSQYIRLGLNGFVCVAKHEFLQIDFNISLVKESGLKEGECPYKVELRCKEHKGLVITDKDTRKLIHILWKC